MAMGIPVISTNCHSGPSEILAESAQRAISGLTFAPYGVLTPTFDIGAMAEAIRAMQDRERCASYGAKGAERAKAFSAAAGKDKYWGVIRDVLREAAHSRKSRASGQFDAI